jgi:positive regulator of sigma E activity
MRTAARVLEVTDERARLGCDYSTENCPVCRGGCALRRLAPGGAARLEVPRLDADGSPLEPGLRVTVEVGDRDLLNATARAALLPVIGMLAGPIALRALGGDSMTNDGVAVLTALGGLLSGWLTARWWLRHMPPRIAVRRDPPAPAYRDCGAAP